MEHSDQPRFTSGNETRYMYVVSTLPFASIDELGHVNYLSRPVYRRISSLSLRFGKLGAVWCDDKKLEVEVNGQEVEELSMSLDPGGKAFFKHWAQNETKSHKEYDRGQKNSILGNTIMDVLQKKRSKVLKGNAREV